MKSIKVSELTGAALDWAVAKCEGLPVTEKHYDLRFIDEYPFSTDWAQGGPIIEREKISVLDANGCWGARKTYWDNSQSSRDYFGTKPLIAAMRCYVASKLGDTIEVPEELL
jgi:hypothetical protein